VDAYLKGDTSFDRNLLIRRFGMRRRWNIIRRTGLITISTVIPFDKSSVESVSRTMESVYDDYCVAQMAKALNKMDDYKFFMNRSSYYKNVYDLI
jgi:hypothetical protein